MYSIKKLKLTNLKQNIVIKFYRKKYLDLKNAKKIQQDILVKFEEKLQIFTSKAE